MDQYNFEHPLRAIVSLWLEKLRLAADRKREEWDKDALDAFAFFRGPYNFLYEKRYMNSSAGFRQDEGDDIPAPTFQMTCNKVAEGVSLWGPVLYHRNPYRQVNPRKVPMPPPELFGNPNDQNTQMFAQYAASIVQQERGRDLGCSQLLEYYLNYTPNKLDLMRHSRTMIDECLITGLGLLWPELYQPPGANFRYAGAFWRSAFDLQADPDMNDLNDAMWVACRRIHPTWLVERKFGLRPGTMKGNYESAHVQADILADPWGMGRRQRGETADLVLYWEIYSKMGLGGRLKGCPPSLRSVLEMFGDYTYLAIAQGTPFPLNLPSEALSLRPDQLMSRLQWHTPFWRMGAWPFATMTIRPVPGRLWPMGIFTSAMGELKFLNWIFSFIASKMRTTGRDFIAIAKSASEELKNKILHGRDLTLIEIEKVYGDTIQQVVQFLQHPQMNPDLFKIIDIVMDLFEKRTGLTELMYGASPHQFRSASEANLKGNQLQIRPDDMAKSVENTMTQTARMEALVARWHLRPQDLQPTIGTIGTQFWQQYVANSPIDTIAHGLDFRIEANSIRKPNRDRDKENYENAFQYLFQPLFSFAQATGQFGPVNALLDGWCKSIDLDPTPFELSLPQLPPQQQPPQQQPAHQGPQKAA